MDDYPSVNDREKTVAAILLFCALKKKKRTRKRNSCLLKPLLAVRDEKSWCTNLVNELMLADRGDYRRLMRMIKKTFEVILKEMLSGWLCI